MMSPLLRATLWLQAGYYLLTGLWPWLHLASFEAVTGPKTDDWLVRTVGLLVAVIGLSLAVAARQRQATPATMVLAIGTALAFLAIDVGYVLVGRIPPVYLADALAEVVLLVLLLAGRRQRA
jgi:hydrogenase/urease accessory protein HupE